MLHDVQVNRELAICPKEGPTRPSTVLQPTPKASKTPKVSARSLASKTEEHVAEAAEEELEEEEEEEEMEEERALYIACFP